MTTTDFTTSLLVDHAPREAFDAIKNIRGWWSAEIESNTDQLNEECDYHFEDIHRAQLKVIEVTAEKEIVGIR